MVAIKAGNVEELVHGCAYRKRLPERSEVLAATVLSLKGKRLRSAQALMRKVELAEWMASRTTDIIDFNAPGAIRIVCAMQHIFRPEKLQAVLTQSGYLDKQADRAARHRVHGNLELAEPIEKHLKELRWCFNLPPKPGRDKHGLIDPRVDVISEAYPALGFAG